MNNIKQKIVFMLIFFTLIFLTTGSMKNDAHKKELKKNQVTKRVGMVIGIHEDKIEEYKQLHADDNPGVRDLLNKYNIHNFSIFLTEIEGKWYEFAYYEYTGENYKADMAKLAREPRNIEWLKVCDPMQIPLPGEEGWRNMEQIYFNE